MTKYQQFLYALQHAPDGLNPTDMNYYLAFAVNCTLAEATEWYNQWLASQESQGDIEPEYYMGHEVETPMDKDEEMDAINPSHYQSDSGVECIDGLQACSTDEEYKGHLRLTAITYLWRLGRKDDALQDARKARWYLDRLINDLEVERECE